jgi:hypothetical protein
MARFNLCQFAGSHFAGSVCVSMPRLYAGAAKTHKPNPSRFLVLLRRENGFPKDGNEKDGGKDANRDDCPNENP